MNPQHRLPTFALLAISLYSSALGSDPELDRLKQAYVGAVERATAPIKATYEKELQKLLQAHTQAGRLDAAAGVMAELKEIGTPSSPPTSSNTPVSVSDRLFIGKSWFTKAGSEYHFNKDGTGYRLQKMDFNDKVTFTWRQLPDGVVEAMQRKQPNAQPTATFFRFVDRKTAFQGDSASNIAAPLSDKK